MFEDSSHLIRNPIEIMSSGISFSIGDIGYGLIRENGSIHSSVAPPIVETSDIIIIGFQLSDISKELKIGK